MTIYMFHGYTSNANDHWFPWLENRVETELHRPFKKLNFPDSDHPVEQAWDQYCDANIDPADGMTLVGHSLGCIQVLHYLGQQDIHNVNVLLVSGHCRNLIPSRNIRWIIPEFCQRSVR